MRLIALVTLLLPLAVIAARESSAVEFKLVELSGCDDFVQNSGDSCFGGLITIRLRVENRDNVEFRGMGAAASGYDGFASFVSGRAVDAVLHETCIPTFGCFDGADNLVGGSLVESVRAEGQSVQFLTVVEGVISDGVESPGLDGVAGGGDAQFELRFQIQAPGQTTLNIGFSPLFGNGLIGPGLEDITPASANIQIVLHSEVPPYIIPEPGVVLLVGLGLMGLSIGRGSASLG